MRTLRTSVPAAALAVALVLLALPAAAADPKPISLSKGIRADLALLGKGVVGKPIPAAPLTDIRPYLNLGDGEWKFELVAGKDKGKSETETYKQESDDRWTRKVGDEYLEHILIGGKDVDSKTAETAISFGYRSTFSPAIHELKGLAPGQSVEVDSKLEVSHEKDPDKIEYTGKMKATVTYEGAYEVTVPAGTFEAILISTAVKIHVGPADVSDTQYVFFAKGVGKVAEVEAQRVAAVLVYHSHDKAAKVLTAYPKR